MYSFSKYSRRILCAQGFRAALEELMVGGGETEQKPTAEWWWGSADQGRFPRAHDNDAPIGWTQAFLSRQTSAETRDRKCRSHYVYLPSACYFRPHLGSLRLTVFTLWNWKKCYKSTWLFSPRDWGTYARVDSVEERLGWWKSRMWRRREFLTKRASGAWYRFIDEQEEEKQAEEVTLLEVSEVPKWMCSIGHW